MAWIEVSYWRVIPAQLKQGCTPPGVHPMSWIFFLLRILVDIIETKKFCEFKISTPFCFRMAAIRNMGGGEAEKVSREMKDLLKGAISLKLNPLKQ